MPYHLELTMSDVTASSSPIKFSWLIGTLAAFTIFAVIAGYSSRMTRDYPDYDEQRAEARKATLAQVQADENKVLYAPAGWIDQGKGIIHIPIDEAMAKEVETLKTENVEMCEVPIVAPAPAAPAPAPATNAAPVKPTATGTNAAPVAPKVPEKTQKPKK